MPAAIAIPAIMSAVGTGAALYSSKKARDAAKPDPETQRMQQQALQLQNQRMQMFNPMLQMMATQAQNRLPQSARGGMSAPTIGQLQTPGAGQAFTQLARRMPPPEGRQRYQPSR